MAFVMLNDVSLAYGERKLLNKVNLTLDGTSKVALVGANGAGKSTLIKILAGKLGADDGTVTFSKEAKVSYMAQNNPINLKKTLYQTADEAFLTFYSREEEIAKLDHLATHEALEERSRLHDALVASGFYTRDGLIDATLIGLGFKRTDFDKPMETFSSGWRIRAALARTLLEEADILLLDEPSNYLDLESTNYLINWLKRFKGSVLLISHDRYFLDQTTTETLELFKGTLKRYSCHYSAYESRKTFEIEQLIRERAAQEERIKQIENFVDRLGAKATKAKQAQSRLKELEKIELVELPEHLKRVVINFSSPPPCGERVLYLEDVAKNYDKPIFNKVTFLVNKGEKVAVVGGNGAGKSTLLRLIAGIDKDFQGYIKKGSGVEVGYFSEETHKPFVAKTVLEEVEREADTAMTAVIRDLLGAFLFRGDDVYKPIAGLSGGEKARLLLLKLFLKPFNLLILDEPTNHLDIAAKDALLEALQKYKGSVLFVSHDRYFVETLAEYVLRVGLPSKYYNGNYDYFLQQSQQEELLTKQTVDVAKVELKQTQINREESKRVASETRKKEKWVNQLMATIEEIEREKQALEQQLALPQVYSSGEKMKEITANLMLVNTKLKELYSQFEEVS